MGTRTKQFLSRVHPVGSDNTDAKEVQTSDAFDSLVMAVNVDHHLPEQEVAVEVADVRWAEEQS